MTKTAMAKHLFIFIALVVLLGGCAAPPREELVVARAAVARAYASGAASLAPTEYQMASEALSDGEQLTRQGQYRMAREILPFAEAHAQRAILKAKEELAVRELQKIREQQTKEAVQEPIVRPPTEPTKKAIAAAAARPAKPKPAPEPPPPPPHPHHYTVKEGETLWSIAARRDIYLDALLWPLIYKANRDQIKDPRQIYPGQELNIPRDTPSAELEEAREKARRSEIFPLDQIIREAPKESR